MADFQDENLIQTLNLEEANTKKSEEEFLSEKKEEIDDDTKMEKILSKEDENLIEKGQPKQQQQQQEEKKDLSPQTNPSNGGNVNSKRDLTGSSNTQRVYKKTSPNSLLTLYLPTREIALTCSNNKSTLLSGLVHIEPEVMQNARRLYVQLTLTFRYGREDEEVMGLRFSNEAIMSIVQLWPRQSPSSPPMIMTPLQEALSKRLGRESLPFTLSLHNQAPPSVQLVPAKRYYGSPIGTSYDVRCFLVDSNNETIERNTSVRMGVRVIYRTDILNNQLLTHESFLPPMTEEKLSQDNSRLSIRLNTSGSPFECEELTTDSNLTSPRASSTVPTTPTANPMLTLVRDDVGDEDDDDVDDVNDQEQGDDVGATATPAEKHVGGHNRIDSEGGTFTFSRLRLSPKAFRFSGRFGRSKSEASSTSSTTSTMAFNYKSKILSETETNQFNCISNSRGPQASVEKPFLLQDGRVSLQACLDKAWYTHGEVILVNIHIRNDSRKTVRKVRVCAIQHVDVCMFNNGKFKNVVAESDIQSPFDRLVSPGSVFKATVTLLPERGVTKNWIALEDSLQRSTEPAEITGAIAASAIRTPHHHHHHHYQQQQQQQQQHQQQNVASSFFTTEQVTNPGFTYPCTGGIGPPVSGYSADSGLGSSTPGVNTTPNERNVFAIYVTYYVKVKLCLSAMGGDLTLKLPFVLVHVNEQKSPHAVHDRLVKLTLDDVPAGKKKNHQQQQHQKQQDTIQNIVSESPSSNPSRPSVESSCSSSLLPLTTPANTTTTTTTITTSSTPINNNKSQEMTRRSLLLTMPRSNTTTDHLSRGVNTSSVTSSTIMTNHRHPVAENNCPTCCSMPTNNPSSTSATSANTTTTKQGSSSA